jgi:hypothetical protein
MDTKKYLYAAVGAPVAVAKTAQSRIESVRTKIGDTGKSLGEDLQKQLDAWAKEGEKLIGRIGESKAIDEITERVDFDQVQEQVTKLRDQLEDLLSTWRTSFRPEKTGKVEIKVESPKVETPVVETPKVTTPKPAAKKPATAARKPATAAKKPAGAAKPAARKPQPKAS